MKRIVYRDVTPLWVPLVTVALIVGFTWGAMIWDGADVGFSTEVCGIVALVLLIAIFLQGWLYWRDQIAELWVDGDKAEARIMRWIGLGRRFTFLPAETIDWRVIPKSTDDKVISSLAFTLKGEEYRMSVSSPQVLDWEGIKALKPAFLEPVLGAHPELKSRP